MNETLFESTLTYYQEQGAPKDQQMLIALLRDVQEMDGQVLREDTVRRIAQELHTEVSLLNALIRRIPSLHPASAPHRLEMCRTCRHNSALAAFIETEYGVCPGSVSQTGGFSLDLVNCMKNCKAGPSIRWDGVLYSHADEKLLRSLIEAQKKP